MIPVAHIPAPALKQVGFNFTQNSYAKARKGHVNKKSGRPPLAPSLVQEIKDCYLKNSKPSPFRHKKKLSQERGHVVPQRYTEKTTKELWKFRSSPNVLSNFATEFKSYSQIFHKY